MGVYISHQTKMVPKKIHFSWDPSFTNRLPFLNAMGIHQRTLWLVFSACELNKLTRGEVNCLDISKAEIYNSQQNGLQNLFWYHKLDKSIEIGILFLSKNCIFNLPKYFDWTSKHSFQRLMLLKFFWFSLVVD